MKLIANFNRCNDWKSGVKVFFLGLALVAGGGCGKSNATKPQVLPPPASDSNSAAAKAVTPPPVQTRPMAPSVSFNAGPNGPTQLQSLNRALLGWKMQNHRQPKTFQEFASTAGYQIPSPPAGKKYTLSSKGFIVLVDSN